MPQLNPAPWFMIMMLSWVALLILFSPKITSITHQNFLLTHDQAPQKTTSWNWPWT